MRKRTFLFIFVFYAILFVFFTPKYSMNEEIATDSECIKCHADLKKLIRLCWEVEKTKPKKGQSAEIYGEG
jgi:hypothetical protein